MDRHIILALIVIVGIVIVGIVVLRNHNPTSATLEVAEALTLNIEAGLLLLLLQE